MPLSKPDNQQDVLLFKDDEELLHFYSDLWGSFTSESNEWLMQVMYDRFPETPNFGILYIRVETAAKLIAADLAGRCTKPTDISDEEANGKRDKHHPETFRKHAIKIEAQIIRAIEQGVLVGVSRTNGVRDLIDHNCNPRNAKSTSVHYIALLKWIIRSGYVPLNRLEKTLPRLCTYGCVEYGLAHEVMGYIAMRRKGLAQLSQGGEVRIYDEEAEVTTIPLSTEEQLAIAYSEIKSLQQQLHSARKSKPLLQNAPINTRTEHTAASIILALAKLKGADLESRHIVSSIERVAKDLNLKLTENPIRYWLKEALAMMPE